MVTIRIGDDERSYRDADERWINQQINLRRAVGQPVCVRVTIKENDAELLFATPDCSSGRVGSRPPNAKEAELISEWRKHRLDRAEFSGGNVVAFLKSIRRFIDV